MQSQHERIAPGQQAGKKSNEVSVPGSRRHADAPAGTVRPGLEGQAQGSVPGTGGRVPGWIIAAQLVRSGLALFRAPALAAGVYLVPSSGHPAWAGPEPGATRGPTLPLTLSKNTKVSFSDTTSQLKTW